MQIIVLNQNMSYNLLTINFGIKYEEICIVRRRFLKIFNVYLLVFVNFSRVISPANVTVMHHLH